MVIRERHVTTTEKCLIFFKLGKYKVSLCVRACPFSSVLGGLGFDCLFFSFLLFKVSI